MGAALFVVDAFATGPGTGNPAAVCLLDERANEAWMQVIAAEMNLSETAFVSPRDDGDYDLRWFTPTAEVELCGHATLATAHVLRTERGAGPAFRFRTRSGALGALATGDGVELDFPADPVSPVDAPVALAKALGAAPVAVSAGRIGYLVELADELAVRGLTPDFHALAVAVGNSVVVTAAADEPGYDFVSRYFAPLWGIPEDPVTGSAHCALAPYWSARRRSTELVGFQASPRGGAVKVRLDGDRVRLAGPAITVLRGELAL